MKIIFTKILFLNIISFNLLALYEPPNFNYRPAFLDNSNKKLCETIIDTIFHNSSFPTENCKKIAYQNTLGLINDPEQATMVTLQTIVYTLSMTSKDYITIVLKDIDLSEEEKESITEETINILNQAFNNSLQQKGPKRAFSRTLDRNKDLESKLIQILDATLTKKGLSQEKGPHTCISCYKSDGLELLCGHHLCENCALNREVIAHANETSFSCPICNKPHNRSELRAQIYGPDSIWTKIARFQDSAR
jgi:rubrerythrin